MEVTGAGSEEQGKKIEQLEGQIQALSTALSELMATLAPEKTTENQNG